MNKVNKYQSLSLAIIESIDKGILQPNDRIPSENDLSTKYNLSRVTVRKAIDNLQKLGYLVRIHGKGTFISGNIINKKLNEIVSFTHSSLLRGEMPTTKVLLVEEVMPTPYLMKNMKISSTEELIHIKRTRYTNDFPLIYEESYWVKSIVGNLTELDASQSLFHYVKEVGVVPTYALQELDAVSASGELSQQLQVNNGFPLLRSLMVFYNQDNKAFELAFNYHRTDRCKLSLNRELSE